MHVGLERVCFKNFKYSFFENTSWTWNPPSRQHRQNTQIQSLADGFHGLEGMIFVNDIFELSEAYPVYLCLVESLCNFA